MKKIRPCILQGTWYPKNPEELRTLIQLYLDKADVPDFECHPVGLISPHAGIIYSGRTAAYSYSILKKNPVHNVYIFSPLHNWHSEKYVYPDFEFFQTPLGLVPVNNEILYKLSEQINIQPIKNDQEHSIEIQLPFLQTVLNDFSIVPIMINHGSVNELNDLINAVYNTCDFSDSIIIASSDLYHISDYYQVHQKDNELIKALEIKNISIVHDIFETPDCSVCGRAPISVLLNIAGLLGDFKCRVLNHTTSGDITGEKSSGQYTVGYLSAVVTV